MTHKYRIVKITDHNNNDKKDTDSVGRINRVIQLDERQIYIGRPMLLFCIDPGFHKSIITSSVHKWETDFDENISILTTDNSKYYFALVKEED